jgi:hypothetical protein
MNKNPALVVAALSLLAVASVTTDARADVVSNPGTFDFNIGSSHDSLFRFTTGKQWFIDDGGAGFIEADVDGSGRMSNMLANFGSGSWSDGTNTFTASLLLQSASTGGINPATGDLEFDLSLKVRFTFNGTACTTSAFAVIPTTAEWSTSGAGACTTGYDDSTGVFCVVNAGFTVPQLAATACGNHGNDINTEFDLGVSSSSYFQILVGDVSPIVQ